MTGRTLPGAALGVLLVLALGGVLRAAPERFDLFDVFVGYDGIVPEAGWFPVVCEIENKGPSFNATFELSGPQGQKRRMPLELPTGTHKRFVLPVFSGSRYNVGGWNAKLLDERGRVRSEALVRPVRRQNPRIIPLLGAVLRTAEGRPIFPEIKSPNQELKLEAARLLPELFPDTPIALEGLSTIYLNSEQAMEDKLKSPQVNALVAWLLAGGHLVIGVEQITHVNGTEWLRRLLPCDLTEMASLASHTQLQAWVSSAQRIDGLDYSFQVTSPQLRPPSRQSVRPGGVSSTVQVLDPFAGLEADSAFEQAPLQIATGTLRDGEVLVGSQNQPLVITARRGRGQITVLTFSPERKPFTEWKHRPQFWAKVAGVPVELFAQNPQLRYAPHSLDGVFGAMVDSRQVRKLPVGWLLLLLVGYLVVIGPFDRWWLKKINRQMLTWVTFPAYVAFFSLLIYYIGYKLRAGETEWNEIHVVDVIPTPAGETADLRGRTFASLYSPSNARYPLAADQPYAALRGEHLGQIGGGQEGDRLNVQQRGNNCVAEMSVPVWTSQLCVNDWWDRAPQPIQLTVQRSGDSLQVRVRSNFDRKLTNVRLVANNHVHRLEDLGPRESRTVTLPIAAGQTLANFVQQNGQMFQQAVQQRQQAFGENRVVIRDIPVSTMASAFVTLLDNPNNQAGFITPSRYELTGLAERGDAVLLAWAAGYAPGKPLCRFSPRRSQRDTLWRVTTPIAE